VPVIPVGLQRDEPPAMAEDFIRDMEADSLYAALEDFAGRFPPQMVHLLSQQRSVPFAARTALAHSLKVS
jgi:hypothetical protein